LDAQSIKSVEASARISKGVLSFLDEPIIAHVITVVGEQEQRRVIVDTGVVQGVQ